jgi:hypothetical protein
MQLYQFFLGAFFGFLPKGLVLSFHTFVCIYLKLAVRVFHEIFLLIFFITIHEKNAYPRNINHGTTSTS